MPAVPAIFKGIPQMTKYIRKYIQKPPIFDVKIQIYIKIYIKIQSFFQYLEQKICSKYHSKVGVKVGGNALFLIRIHAHAINEIRPVIISIHNSNELLCSNFDLPNSTCVSVREVKVK